MVCGLKDEGEMGRVPENQTGVKGHQKELSAQGGDPHQHGAHGIDVNLVVSGQDAVLDVPAHCPGSGAVTGKRPIHDCEQSGVDLLLAVQKVCQRPVAHRVRPVAFGVQQPA